MKVKTLALAGAAAFGLASVATADVTFEVVHNTGDDFGFLADNNLQSVTIQATVPDGIGVVGILGVGIWPWSVVTDSPDGFFNTAGAFGYGGDTRWSARVLAQGDEGAAEYWDSGFSSTANQNFGGISTGLGSDAFALSSGENEEDVIGSVIGDDPEGWDGHGGDPIDLFHVTWSADHSASGTFLFATVEQDYEVAWAVPAPGALALLGLAGLVGTRRRRT